MKTDTYRYVSTQDQIDLLTGRMARLEEEARQACRDYGMTRAFAMPDEKFGRITLVMEELDRLVAVAGERLAAATRFVGAVRAWREADEERRALLHPVVETEGEADADATE